MELFEDEEKGVKNVIGVGRIKYSKKMVKRFKSETYSLVPFRLKPPHAVEDSIQGLSMRISI